MGYFDVCEVCGQDELLVIGGLCHACQEKEDKAAAGGPTLRRAEGIVTVHDPFRVRTVLAGRAVEKE